MGKFIERIKKGYADRKTSYVRFPLKCLFVLILTFFLKVFVHFYPLDVCRRLFTVVMPTGQVWWLPSIYFHTFVLVIVGLFLILVAVERLEQYGGYDFFEDRSVIYLVAKFISIILGLLLLALAIYLFWIGLHVDVPTIVKGIHR